MTKKIKNNGITYAIKCSKCKKIMVPQAKKARLELRQLTMVEELAKAWVVGKINIFPEVPNHVRKFIAGIIYSYIDDHIFDLVFDSCPVCHCERGSYTLSKVEFKGGE